MFKKYKFIEVIPPELREQFDSIQLNNSIRRIRILTIIALAAKIINPLFIILTKNHLNLYSEVYFNYIDYSEMGVIVLFNIAAYFFEKNNNKRILWIFCYLTIAVFFILYELMNFTETIDRIQQIFFVTVFLFTILPDFKPKIFITFALLYVTAIGFFPMIKNQPYSNEYIEIYSRILIVFVFIVVTKVLLYNTKVKTFVNTFEINKLNDNLVAANKEIEKQKDELKYYNDNLEKLVFEKTEKNTILKNAVMETMAQLVEYRDDVTGGHITRTSRLLKIIINAMAAEKIYSEQITSWNIEQMILSAQLHDVGKIAIDDRILHKPGKLTPEEFETMKSHTVLGGEIIRKIQSKTGEQEFLDFAFIFAVYHHEKWDGSGYPYKKAGEDIPLPARLMAIVDVYDALVSERPYKKAFSSEEAIQIIKDGKGVHFDPVLTDLFTAMPIKILSPSS